MATMSVKLILTRFVPGIDDLEQLVIFPLSDLRPSQNETSDVFCFQLTKNLYF